MENAWKMFNALKNERCLKITIKIIVKTSYVEGFE